MKDLTLPEARSERDALADHAEVLDRVGALMLLPGDTYATTDLVAGYYQVTANTLHLLVSDHRAELDSDGFRILRGEELTVFKTVSGLSGSRAPSLALFPRRAILRVGMLLRDSTIARAVRDALLDAERRAQPPVDVTAISRRMLAQMVIEAEDRADLAEARLLEAEPAIEYHHRYVSQDDVVTVKAWGAQFGLTEPQAFALLIDRKVVYRYFIGERWSNRRQKKVQEFEHRARAGRSFGWFDLRPQHNAPRHHNGQVRQTLYVRQAHALDLGRRLGLDPVGVQGHLQVGAA